MFLRLVYSFLFISGLVISKIQIRDANVAVVSRDDIAMLFYVTILNTDTIGYDVRASMISCTEIMTASDRDTGIIHLMGGHMGHIHPRCYKNITLIYPTMVLHNRRGYCIISLKFKTSDDRIAEKKANISFDTTVAKKNFSPILRDYFTKSEVSTCSSIDLDPLNKCKMLDCHMRYGGTRNFYNKKWRRCQKVPVCIADLYKELPDVIYAPVSNKCRDMEKSVVKEELLQMDDSPIAMGPCEEKYHTLMNIDCHFGKYNNISGYCDCHDGWSSVPINKDEDAAYLFVVHMCNIEGSNWYDKDSKKIKILGFLIGVGAILIFMVMGLGFAYSMVIVNKICKTKNNCIGF